MSLASALVGSPTVKFRCASRLAPELGEPPTQTDQEEAVIFQELRRLSLEGVASELEHPAHREQPQGELPQTADEQREGYISKRPNITARFPFREGGLVKEDILRILDEAGVGLPSYYSWRTRSGCFFCFFQRKYEWVRLAEEHPDLFQRAVQYEEKVNFEEQASSRRFTWSQGESLLELLARKDQIVAAHEDALARERKNRPNRPLSEVLAGVLDAEDDAQPCTMCQV